MYSKAAMERYKSGTNILQIRKLVRILHFPHLFQEVRAVMTNSKCGLYSYEQLSVKWKFSSYEPYT